MLVPDDKPATVRMAEHYHQYRQQLAKKEDPLSFLQHGTKEDIMTFLKWILDEYRVRKRSTLHEYWKVWRMLYRRYVGYSLHAKIAGDINDVGTPSRSL
jgi:hypothetical protein